MNKKRILVVAIMVIAILAMFPFTAAADTQNGFVSVGSGYEYYIYGEKVVDQEIWDDTYNNYYRFDANGKMLSATWWKDPSTLEYYYYKADGSRAYDEVYKVGSIYYGFEYSGIMYDDEEFSVYSEQDNEWKYYIARKGGALVTNEWLWVVDEYSHNGGYYTYYGADGACYMDGIYKIGNAYYAFFGDGAMLNKMGTEIHDKNTDSWVYVRAKAGGALYCNEWVKLGSEWYYYKANGHAASGETTIGSTTYYFYADGQMVADTLYYSGEKGCTYFIDKNGAATKLAKNGWTNVNGDYYYCENGQAARDGIKHIGNAYYYFFWDGKILNNAEDSVYDEEIEDWKYIRARAGGALYCGAWHLNDDKEYEYYGNDCFQIEEGFMEIDGSTYYFEGWIAAKNQIIETDSAIYVADSSCRLTVCPNNSWVRHPETKEYYYVENNQFVRNAKKEIDGSYYIFNDEGRLWTDQVIEFWPDDEEDPQYYIVDKSGRIVTQEGWKDFYGEWYYINSDGTLKTGMHKINGTDYYLYPEMQYATLDYWWDEAGVSVYCVMPDGTQQKVTSDGEYDTPYGTFLIENGKVYCGWKYSGGKFYYYDYSKAVDRMVWITENERYYFDNAGIMQTGWIPYGDTWMYADGSGKLVVDGLQKIDNVYYIFDDCLVLNNEIYNGPDGIYISDNNGVATKLESGSGWKSLGGNWYYSNGDYLARGEVQIEGDWYFFEYDTCRMVSGRHYNGYYYDVSGRRYTGWLKENGAWYYYDPHPYTTGEYEIDGHRYYFDQGVMISNTTYFSYMYDRMYVINAAGHIVDEYDVPNGIVYQDGTAYMFKDGWYYDGWSGENYFDDGRMAIDETITWNGNTYYLDKHGKYIHNGWYQRYEDGWYYARANGALYKNEWLSLGGSWYYFDSVWMCSDGVYYIENEDKWANFDKNGKFLGYVAEPQWDAVKGSPNSWKQISGYWYYFNPTGTIVYGETLYIGGVWYAFDDKGRMVTNDFVYDYRSDTFNYYTASGARLNAHAQWRQIKGEWCYFNADGTVAYGWVNDGGKSYYIDVHYTYDQVNERESYKTKLAIGYALIDGDVYRFDASGVCKGKHTGNGWLQLNTGDYVYFKNGKLLRDGVYTIGSDNYYFYSDGIMATGIIWNYSNNHYYADASGRLIATKGWYKDGSKWVYVNEYGAACVDGVYKIDGNVYFFDEEGYWIF